MGQIIATLGIIATLRPSSSTNSENTKKRKRDNSSCSEEDERIISSSLPSSSTARWKHDVFLSFRGEDTRSSFTDHLYSYLKWKGILVFRDDESLKRGKCISQELSQAIQQSRYAIVIFSENYAFSKWCLRELAEIVEWKEKKNLTIIPIFYHVDPSDVRNQRGTFAKAFAEHEKDPKVDIKEINTWRKACKTVGGLKGEHIKGDRYESTIIQKISEMIFYNYTLLNILIHDNQKIVGINSRVEEMMNLLHMESNDVRFLGIHGMGGVGKTTLAEIIYYRFSCRFEGSSFICCTRERSTTARDLASLQEHLLSTIIQDQEIRIRDHRDGIMLMRNRLQNKKVLIILDDVDCEKLVSALAGDRKWFGPGSRVIITCRDSHLLITHEVNDIYKVELLQTADALQLFSLSAFNKTNPPENYKDLSMDFVSYAGGLPLALKVLGRFLFGRTIDLWKSARDKLEAIPKTEIFDILKISFDGLEESQKKLFLDLACFGHMSFLKEIYPAIDFEVLLDKSLVSKSCLMHHLLKKMGQEIVRREDPEEPGRRSRLWREEDVFPVLEKDTGTDAIESIVLNDYCPDIDCAQDFKHRHEANYHRFNINAKAFSKMRKLRCLYFDGFECCMNWRGNPLEYMPSDKLQLLHWRDCPSEYWPRSFRPKNLVELNMTGSCFKQLWNGLMVLDNLKELDLSNCKNLIETPDLSGAPNLEKINLWGCRSLCEVHPSIGTLKRLQELIMPGTGIKTLWKGTLVVLDNLKKLDLSDCENLIETPDLSGAPNLEKINLGSAYIKMKTLGSCRSLCEVHPSIGTLKQLKELIMLDTGIKKLWNGTLVVLPNLKYLSLRYSNSLIEIPDLSGAPNLEKINLESCRNLCEVHPSIGTLKQLQELIMPDTGIKKLWKGTLVVLDNLKELDLSNCKNLIETPDLSGAPNLEKINLRGCRSLCEVHPSIGTLKRLQELIMPDTGIKKLWKGTLVVLDNLKKLDLSNCENLIETPDLSGAPNLEEINLGSCRSLCEVHPSMGTLKQLRELIIPDLGIKKLWNETLVVLPNLKYLSLSDFMKLIETPDLSRVSNLEKIDFSNCTSRKVHGNFMNILRDITSLESLSLPSWEVSIFPSVIYSLSSLKRLRLDGWSRLEKLPDLSMFECLKEFKAYGTAISQIPSINLPKSICFLELKGGKRMPRESRDLVMFINDCSLPKQSSYPTNHDIGLPVEYEMEEKFWVRIHFLSLNLSIQRCSLGSRIPKWVHNKSKGSSLKMELDGNTMSVMGIAIFIVCQFHSIPPINFHGYERVAFQIWLDDNTPKIYLYEFSFALPTDVILDKPIVLWEYYHSNGRRLKSLDRRKISIATKLMNFDGQTPCIEVELKEWGLHLECPDDAALDLGSDLDSFVNIINLALKRSMTRNEDSIHQEYPCQA